MARDFLPRQDVQIADPSGRTTTPFYVWMQSLERAFGALDVDLAALLEQIEQLKPGQQLAFEGAMSVTVTNVDGTITISLDGDNDSPGGNWYYGTNADGVRGFWPVADGVSGGYSITKAVDYGPYDYQGELDTPDELPYPVVVGDAYLINGDLWVGADDGGDDGAGWDNLGPAPTTAVLSLVNDEATPDPTSYYGTNAAGEKGWHAASDTMEAAPGELTKSVDSDGVTTFGLPDITPESGGTLQRYGFDAKGRRIEEEAADTDDLAEGSTNLYFTNARADARITAQKGQPNGLATLDSDAKLEANQLPALAITDTFVVNTEAAMLSLDAQQGDVAVRTDEQKSYILTADPASTLGNWQELLTPTGTGGTVTSVALSVPTGLTVSGSPITSSGTITVSYDTGYQGYTSAEASKLSGIASGATVGADWNVNLSNIPANIASWAGISPASKANDSDVVKTSGNQTGLSGNKVWTGSHQVASLAVRGPNIAVADDSNAHLWFREADNTTARGLVYSDGATRRLGLRSYEAGGVVYTQLAGDAATRTWTIDGNTIWHDGNIPANVASWATIAPASKANDSDVVKTSGNQSGLSGTKQWTGEHTFGAVTVAGSNYVIYGAGNTHLWFRDADNSTARGLLYSDATTRRIILRSYAIGGSYTQLRGDPSNNSWQIDGSEIWRTSNLADSGWQALTLSNSWTNQGGSPTYGPAACRKFGAHVMLRGLLVPGTTTDGTTMFTLPVGYRPATAMRFPIVSNGSSQIPQLQVNTDGTVQCFGLAGNTAAITVAHISFFTD